MEELVIEKLDGSTIRRRYINWKSFRKEELESFKLTLEEELIKVNNLLKEFL